MTKANIPQYSATAASNTDVEDIDIAENCAPSGINNAIREIMADLKDQDTGAVAMTSPVATSLTVTNEITANGGIALGDNDKAKFGSADDLEIYHDGSHSYIDESGGTGNLRIRATNLVLQSVGEEDYATFIANGAATLFYDNAEKIATSSTGIAVTGNASFADNGKATFGAGDDLQIYHNANNSFIQDAGTGSLYIDGSASVNIRETSTNAPMAVLTGSGSVDLYHNGIKKISTSATGIDVTGTATMDGLTVDGAETEAATSQLLKVRNSTTGEAATIGLYAKADNGGEGNSGSITFDAGADGSSANNELRFNANHQTGTNPALSIKGNGDISFYNTAGTSQTLFWDASATSLGIGTDSPSKQLHQVRTGSASDLPTLSVETGFITQSTNSTASSQNISIMSGNIGEGRLFFGDTDDEDVGKIVYNHTSNYMAFDTAANERMRISSAGHTTFGTTDLTPADNSVNGTSILSDGRINHNAQSQPAAVIGRTGTDGTIAEFRKNGAIVGRIGTVSGRLGIGTGDAALFFDDDNNKISPVTMVGGTPVDSNGLLDLGYSGGRFKNLFLSDGVYLGGTGAANYLDDYEEGTWTPIYRGTTTNGSNTYDKQLGYYTKIGNLVTATLRIRTDALSGMTGSLRLAGLPFSVRNLASGLGGAAGGIVVHRADNFGVNYPTSGYAEDDTDRVVLSYVSAINADPDSLTIADLRTTGNANDMMATITYLTAT